ncbi:uncharacterized protein LOC142980973 [Anticarsia gemmatalis]|uniref:uncharacterized protein LOC142980973 n=1 Tax=Anticarsia gemmatalis TaxID=129554 RepID=UPI003F7725FA
MRRLIINCLLLATIVAAESNEREKRHIGFIKNLISSVLFGGSSTRDIPPPPVLQQDTEYELYRVPGFEDVLVRAKPTLIERTVVRRPEEVIKINPLEAYIGTNNPQETVVAFQNVNNLLSTEIVNRQESGLIRETMVPIVSSLGNYVVEEEIVAAPVIEEIVQPVIPEVVKPYETDVKIELPYKPNYSYKQIERNLPVMTYTARNNPDVVVRQRIDLASSLPMCVKQRIDGVVSLGANPQQIHQSGVGRYAHLIEQFSHNSNEPIKVTVLHNNEQEDTKKKEVRPLPLKHSHDENKEGKPVSTPKDNAHDAKGISEETIKISQTLWPMPPQYISATTSELNKPKVNDQDTKTNVKTSDNNVKTNNVNENIVNAADHVSKDGTVSHYVYKQVTHDKPNVVSLARQKDTADTASTNSPLDSSYVYVPPVINTEPPKQVTVTASPFVNKPNTGNVGKHKENPLLQRERENFRNNPIVVTEGNYIYSINKNDGNILSVRKNENAGAVVNKSQSGRGDIPGQ